MTERRSGASPERRPADDPGYARLEVFKEDLRAMFAATTRDGKVPGIRPVLTAAGIRSTDTVPEP